MKEIENLMNQLMHLGIYTNFKIIPRYDDMNNYCGLGYETYIARVDVAGESEYHRAFCKHDTVEQAAKRFSDYITNSKSEVIAFHKAEIERLNFHKEKHEKCLSNLV